MHTISDASELVNSALVCGQWSGGAGSYNAGILLPKACAARLKSDSIPSLEINAAVLALRMVHTGRKTPLRLDRSILDGFGDCASLHPKC